VSFDLLRRDSKPVWMSRSKSVPSRIRILGSMRTGRCVTSWS